MRGKPPTYLRSQNRPVPVLRANKYPATRVLTLVQLYGYIGLAIILVAEAFLFAGNQFTGRWFTPIVWTGYILFSDALIFRVRGRSLLTTDRVEFLIIIIVSIACWWLFEF